MTRKTNSHSIMEIYDTQTFKPIIGSLCANGLSLFERMMRICTKLLFLGPER